MCEDTPSAHWGLVPACFMILDRNGGRGQCQTQNVCWGLCKRPWRWRIWKRGMVGKDKFLLMRGFVFHYLVLLGNIAFAPHSHPILQDCICKTVSFFTKWFVFKSQCSKFNLWKWKEVLGCTHTLFINYYLIGHVDKGK